MRKGTWRNGEFTGWGRESRRNRDVLEGKFINGNVCGKGYLKNNRGNIYFGDFVNSKREGYGELYTNKIHYIGEFRDDQLNGKGVIEFLKEGHKYEGEFKNNEINGKGIFSWKNGDVYEGEMSNGKEELLFLIKLFMKENLKVDIELKEVISFILIEAMEIILKKIIILIVE